MATSLNGDQPAPDRRRSMTSHPRRPPRWSQQCALVVVTMLPRGDPDDDRKQTSIQMSSLFGNDPALIVPYTVTVTVAPVTVFQIA